MALTEPLSLTASTQPKCNQFWVDWDELDFSGSKVLGSGGFGAVKLATHKHWGTVAVKQTLYRTITEEIRRDINKEVDRLWDAVSCPNVVTVRGIAQERPDEAINIIMEHMQKGNLKRLAPSISTDVVTWPLRVRMIHDMVTGMNFLHTLKPPLIHRDLKLENVFVNEGYVVKIGDLGLTCSQKSCYQSCDDETGTFTHMPPEIVLLSKPRGWDPRKWDIWSFAITLFEFLSNDDPWESGTGVVNHDLLFVWLKRDLRPNLNSIPAGNTPPQIIEEMRKCWHKDSFKRPTFQELQDTFSALYNRQYARNLSRAMEAVWCGDRNQNEEARRTSIDCPPESQEKNDILPTSPPTVESIHSLSSATSPVGLQSLQSGPTPLLSQPNEREQHLLHASRISASAVDIKRAGTHSAQRYRDLAGCNSRSAAGPSPVTERVLHSPVQESGDVRRKSGNQSSKRYTEQVNSGRLRIQQPQQRSRSASPRPPSQKTQVNQSDKVVTNNDIQKIDKYIGKKYRVLGRYLNISNEDIEAIEMQYRDFGPQEIVHQVLRKWIGKYGRRATKSILSKALCRADLSHVAQKL